LHAAKAILAGRALVDPPLAAAIATPAKSLGDALAAAGFPAALFWQHLVPAVVGSPSLDFASGGPQWVAMALERAGRLAPAGSVQRLAEALVELEAAFVAARPGVAEELPLRREPLRGQWEARGPGLLAAVRRLTSPDWLARSATVVLVPPLLGGGGQAYPGDGLVTFEALLANPLPRLPEVLRLGWFLAQLQDDGIPTGPHSGPEDWRKAVPLALVAVVLAAAEDVELASADRPHMEQALTVWLDEAAAAETLCDWWQDYARRGPGWPAGLDWLAQKLG
jgi:hypothetical protein